MSSVGDVEWLEPVATHGPRMSASGEPIPCVDRRAPYVPEALPPSVSGRGAVGMNMDHHYSGGPRFGEFMFDSHAASGERRKGGPPSMAEFDAAACSMGEFAVAEVQKRMSCSTNAVFSWRHSRLELGWLRRVRVGVYLFVGEVQEATG